MIKFILVDGKGGNGSVYYVAADVDSKIVGDSNGQKQRLFQSRLLLNLAGAYCMYCTSFLFHQNEADHRASLEMKANS